MTDADADADVVVAGAGHNSLITAAYLCRAGHRCLVLDARSAPGGGVASEELLLPGFQLDSCSTGHTLIQTNPLLTQDELDLIGVHGLTYIEPDPVAHVIFPDGESLTMWLDLERTCEEIARFSAARCRGLPAAAGRVRRRQGRVRAQPLHADRLRPELRRAARGPPGCRALAPAGDDERLRRRAPRVLESARARVHAVDGLSDRAAGGLSRVGHAGLLDHLRPPTSQLDAPSRRLG